MIPIEFYVKFNLSGEVKPKCERNQEEKESMVFRYPGGASAQSFSQPKKNLFQKRYVGLFAMQF
jgi:hypothetical protein